MGNPRVKAAKQQESDERPYSVKMKLPALGILVFSVTPQENVKKPSGKMVVEKSASAKNIVETKTRRKKK